MAEALQRSKTSIATEGSRPEHGQRRRKVVDSAEVEQSCKFKEDSLVIILSLEIEAKRQNHEKKIAQMEREKQRMKEIERSCRS